MAANFHGDKLVQSPVPAEQPMVVNILTKSILWMASQLTNLSRIVERAADYPITSFLACLVVLILTYFWYCCCNKRYFTRRIDLSEDTPAPSRPMRKRDIMRHLGKRVIRVGGSRLRDLRRRSSLTFRFQPPPNSSEIQLHKEPPAAYLEADIEIDSQIPHDVMYLLKSVRVFGHFEKPLFMQLCKHVETKFVPAGAILFRPGQVDDSIYVVQNGKLNVFLVEQDGSELPLKEAGTGDSVHSLLSLLDAIVGQPHPFKSVAARAIRDTYVLQIRARCFIEFFNENPDSLLRIIQIIMLRLQRVTFLALSQFLGLGHELLIQKMSVSRELHISKLKRVPYSHVQASSQPVEETIYEEGGVLSLGDERIKPFSAIVEGDSEDSEGGGINDGGIGDSLTSINIQPHNDPVKSDTSSTTGDEHQQLARRSHKTVAIDVTQNESFSHRLLPSQSPEFDNVINQARVDRMEFGGSQPVKANLIQNVPLRYSHFVSLEGSQILQAATNDLIKILQLKDDSLLKGRIQLIEVATNSILGCEGDLDSCVYFIVSGKLKVYKLSKDNTQSEELLYVAIPGEFVGVLSALTGEPSFISVKASTYSHLVAITKTNLYQILSEHPLAVCGLVIDLVRRLSPFVRQMDFALDWMDLEAGKALYKQGEESNVAYIILNGRLRSVVKNNDGKKELVDEYGRGETVGVVEVMTKSSRATTVHAIRDTELASIPVGLLNTIKLKKPQVVSRLIQLLGEKIIGSYSRALNMPTTSVDKVGMISKHFVSNLSTVAVVPITPDIPLSHLARHLTAAISTIAPAKRLTSQLIQEELGTSALESVHEYRLCTWLGHQEDTHGIVLYQADCSLTQWTARCIRQADCILLVGIGDQLPNFESMGTIVTQVEKISARVRKELILLHKEGTRHPQGTVKWLNALGWLSSYFHVRCPNSFFYHDTSPSMEELSPPPPDKHSDIARLARRLTGTSVGVVLGGGGARGLAHCGVLKAFQEAGIPVDMIGGTSIGALIGGLYCEECDADEVCNRASVFSRRMSSYWDKLLDLTYPSMSMFTGRAFNRIMYNTFGDRHIEDLWLPYFCVTTDVTESKMKVHSGGCLWRYVRASMSLSGYLPPLCDPVDGHLLLDGGYVNNLPADLMYSQGAEIVIAIDVGSEDNNDLMNYGDSISGWRIIWNKLNPFSKTMRIPNLTEIQSRLAYVSCVRQLAVVKNDSSCEYIRPPIDNISTLQFGNFDDIYRIGYKHCKTVLNGWSKNHTLSHLMSDTLRRKEKRTVTQRLLDRPESGLRQKVSSIHDLAALAAEIPSTKKTVNEDGLNDDEEILGYWSNPEVGGGNVLLVSTEGDSDDPHNKDNDDNHHDDNNDTSIIDGGPYSDSELQVD